MMAVETVVMTLTEFLLARIAEDEAAAMAAQAEGAYPWMGDAAEEVLEMAHNEGCAGFGIAHFARHDPARVLAECEAKRRIVEQCAVLEGQSCDCGGYGRADDMVRALALPYADHPDYDEAWRP